MRRATELMRQAMASEDSDEIGLRAESVLADVATASTLLGGPEASTAAQAAVVQRFGRVGALLVLGYEERVRSHRLVPVDSDGTLEPAEGTDPRFETLVRDFAHLDAKALYAILCEIDEDEPAAGDRLGLDAHRWLHATYAVAARDGTPGAHRAYMSRAGPGHAPGEAAHRVIGGPAPSVRGRSPGAYDAGRRTSA